MNIFLIHRDPFESAKQFVALDPVRARKQLLECCQILATVDHLLLGSTTMLKADGTPYKRAHQHHPITKRCAEQYGQYRLCFEVAYSLAHELLDHACSISLSYWCSRGEDAQASLMYNNHRLLVCRKGQPQVLVDSREEYAAIMSAYLAHKHALDQEKKP